MRPVTGTGQGELEYRHYRFPDGSEPKLLDIIRIGFSTPSPAQRQPENWLIDGSGWELIARPARGESARIVVGSVSENPLLFGNSGKSVPYARFERQSARESLLLVEPGEIEWLHLDKARVQFSLGDFRYRLPLTDPSCVVRVKNLAEGSHRSVELGIAENRKILFTISLSEPLDGVCYKLVAAVIVVPLGWHGLFD